MKRRRSWSLSALVVVCSLAAGCEEDVGRCDKPLEARDTVVLASGSVQYAGQAIMNASCAGSGCHSSRAKGAARSGAPQGLDFDLVPAKASGTAKNEDGDTIGKISQDDIAGLRRRQERVVQERSRIWQQVKDGLMPPDGAFSARRKLASLFDSNENDPCTRKSEDSFEPINDAASKEVLRNWLACGAPIVEANTEAVTKRTAGTVGYQYPQCEMQAEPDTIEFVQARVFDDYCSSCHPGTNDLELDTAAHSYASLVENDYECMGKPFVTPGDVENSYLYDLVSKEEPDCHERMPYGGDPLSDEDLKIIADWIEAGAGRAE